MPSKLLAALSAAVLALCLASPAIAKKSPPPSKPANKSGKTPPPPKGKTYPYKVQPADDLSCFEKKLGITKKVLAELNKSTPAKFKLVAGRTILVPKKLPAAACPPHSCPLIPPKSSGMAQAKQTLTKVRDALKNPATAICFSFLKAVAHPSFETICHHIGELAGHAGKAHGLHGVELAVEMACEGAHLLAEHAEQRGKLEPGEEEHHGAKAGHGAAKKAGKANSAKGSGKAGKGGGHGKQPKPTPKPPPAD
jgi:hypothetical protein